MDLAELQKKLLQQYTQLRDLRATENYPVYVIEHGLTAEELSTAKVLLNASLISNRRASNAFWLLWIVAAAEVGYHYNGGEYWDSFDKNFPDWPRFGDRDRIRKWYQQFKSQFSGLAPSGPWAQQFPIIAWPITQAILPKYLQRYFADHLYDLRHMLVRNSELTLGELGELLSERYHGGSSRFEGFLQQKALTARIVMAMRLEDVEDTISPIEKTTLQRILDDLDKLGSLGTRLREVRGVLREIHFINSYRSGFVPKTKATQNNALIPVTHLERPRLLARQIGEMVWNLTLALPDLATVLLKAGLSPRDPECSQMRFRSYGQGNTWMPGRALFSYSGDSEEPLATYLTTDLTVFEFDRPVEKIMAALRDRLVFPTAPLRLLKVRADGTAVEVAGRHVRVNQSYILVASGPMPTETVKILALAPVHTKTAATHVWHLSVPARLDSTKIAALRTIGLGYTLGIRAEPLGLTARWDDVDETLVFLDSEIAMFHLMSDVAVREFQITMDTRPPVRLAPAAVGNTLVALGKLSLGRHRVSVSAIGAASDGDIAAEEILITVRPELPWQKAASGKAGVALMLEPRDATLDQLLDHAAILRVSAPAERTVKLKIRFYGADGMLFHQELVGRYKTPVSDERVSACFIQKLISDAQVEHVERSARIEALISLDEYGYESVVFDKDVEPLRWLRVDERTIRLSDDTAETTPPSVRQYDLNSVEISHDVDYQQALVGIELHGKGGLLVANLNGHEYETVATTLQRQLSNFSDLGVPARVSAGEQHLPAIISALKLWRAARSLIGPMAFLARRNAMRALKEALELFLCGNKWIVDAGQVRAGALEIGALYKQVYFSHGFAAGLRVYDWQYDTDAAAAESEFLRLIDAYKVPDANAFYHLCLKLAFQPHVLNPVDLPSGDALHSLRNSALIRGAYFARLVADLRAAGTRSEAA